MPMPTLRSRFAGGAFFLALAILAFRAEIDLERCAAQEIKYPVVVRHDDEESKRFLGTWKVVRTEFAGDGQNPRTTTADYVHFSRAEAVDWFTGSEFGKYYDAWSVDPQAAPKRLNYYENEPDLDPRKDTVAVHPAIYEWDGPRLKIVVSLEEAPLVNDRRAILEQRPTAFATTKENQTQVYLILERVTDEKITLPKRP